jgi:hypothetical protein
VNLLEGDDRKDSADTDFQKILVVEREETVRPVRTPRLVFDKVTAPGEIPRLGLVFAAWLLAVRTL